MYESERTMGVMLTAVLNLGVVGSLAFSVVYNR